MAGSHQEKTATDALDALDARARRRRACRLAPWRIACPPPAGWPQSSARGAVPSNKKEPLKLFGSGSKQGTRNGTLANGNMD